MLVFLELNNFFLNYDSEELIEIIFRVADNSLDYSDLLIWLKKHIEF